MKELFRELDFTRVALFQLILESEGIPTMIRNHHLTNSGLTTIPIVEFYPALCVMNDEDYGDAVQVIRDHVLANQRLADEEVRCSTCGETSPATFDICWSCEGKLSA